MKNGEPRSGAWIARQLKAYKRDNQAVQTVLSLVSVDPIPSVHEIATWTDEQCVLAEDWGMNVHASASDNNNRVPAVPKHLEPYQRTYPTKTRREAALACVEAMSADNGADFKPSIDQWARLEAGVELMQKAGCFFTEAQIELFAAGEHSEMLDHFQRFDGFEIAQDAMLAIFEEQSVFAFLQATDAQKAAAFEWLRVESLKGDRHWFKAAVLMEELVRLNAGASVIAEVAGERHRQIHEERWTPDHDDFHAAGELALAGAAYALQAGASLNPNQDGFEEPPECWPWDRKWWKPKDPRRDLVRAAALIVAEIERLDRETKTKESK